MERTKKQDTGKDKARQKEIPAYKTEKVASLAKAMQEHPTVLIASIRKLPSSQFHAIKKQLRGTAEISIAKKSLVVRAIESLSLPGIADLKTHVGADVALFFSDLDPFALAGVLADSQSPAKAKGGDIAPEDIHVEPGPIAKQGDVIKENVASVMAKLGIMPMKVGFEPLAAYDSKAKKVYVGIKIDKKAVLAALREAIGKSKGFAVNVKYISPDTIGYFISKAGMEEKAILNLLAKAAPATEGATA